MYYRSVLIAVWTCLIRTCLIRTNSRQILLDSCRQLSSWASWRERLLFIFFFLLLGSGTMSWFQVLLITLNGVAKYVQNKQQHIAWMLLCHFVNDILYFLIITFLTLILKVCIYVGLWTCHAWTAPGLIVSVTTAPSPLAGRVHSIRYHGDEHHSIGSWHATSLSTILRVFQVGVIFEHEVAQIPWTLCY